MPRLGEAEARRRFTAAPVARLATVDAAGRPHQVPVVFAHHVPGGADRLVTAVDHRPKTTTRLKRLANLARHPAVCLLVDACDEDWDRLRWVRADGEAGVLPPGAADPAVRRARETALALLCAKCPRCRARPPAGPVADIAVLRWTGRRTEASESP
ncbi:TIGR03668 family PPOX class F420-dependent oxidoreductase [Streptomyces sp. NPDC056580]|uniref:TIGR03668 family PPOX class F420-dependent oxidoreductase n=1 Tax=Streptomyces sp. NPDC056580 TaxID=3345872 RepID=UPI0036D06165